MNNTMDSSFSRGPAGRAARRAAAKHFAAIALISSAAFAADPQVEVLTRSGAKFAGTLSRWSADGLVVNGGGVRTSDVWTLRFPDHIVRPVEGDWLVLANGDRIPVSVRRARDDTVEADWTNAPLRPAWNGPLESVSAFVYQLPAAPRLRRQWLAAIEKVPSGADHMQFVTGDRLSGEFTQLDGLALTVKAAFGPTQLDRQRVRWLRLDRELQSFPEVSDPWWCAWLTDGSRITATDCRPGDNLDVTIELPIGGAITVAQHEIVKLQRFDERIAPLSRRTPKSTTYTPYLSGERAVRVDRNVLGGPLVVRGEEFAVGLGMASRMSVTYPLEPGDREFRAFVGIDDAAEGRGSVRFRIHIDGRVVWESDEVTGAMPLVTCPPASLSSAKELTVEVDFGQFGDVGDIANWCDAVIVRRE